MNVFVWSIALEFLFCVKVPYLIIINNEVLFLDAAFNLYNCHK